MYFLILFFYYYFWNFYYLLITMGICSSIKEIPKSSKTEKNERDEDKNDKLDTGRTDNKAKTARANHPKKIMNQLELNNDVIITRNEQNLENLYSKKKILGKGAFGEVWLVRNNQLQKDYAMKIIKKTSNSESEENEIMNEISILKKLDHPKILKILDFYSTTKLYYIITEYCPNGELYNEIIKKGKFDEGKTAFIMNQIFKAIAYCHSQKIIHRDLKPENIMISKKETNGCLQVKLIDFGTARIFKNGQSQKHYVGSSYYMAPEILNRNYDEKCDIWSCGVIMYILLSGKPPFDGNDDNEILDKIKIGKYDLNCYPFYNLSDECIDLIQKLLTYEPNKRISGNEALEHKWFKRKDFINKNKINVIPKSLAIEMINNMKNYNKNDNILYCAVIAYLVHNNLNDEQCIEAEKLFNKIDLDSNGKIEKHELKKGMLEYWKLSEKEIEKEIDEIYNNIDTDHNGYIEYEEFIRAAVNPKTFLSKNYLRFAFRYFDTNNSGGISFDEIKRRFMQNSNNNNAEVEKELKIIYDSVDINHDGSISFDEFCKMMKNIINSS